MLKKELRLSPNKSFWRTQNFRTPFFILYVKENGMQSNRFGFQISKKIDKRAVVRNKIKRILSVCLEENLEKIRVGYDMMFVVKKNISGEPQTVLCERVFSFLKKEQLLK